MGYNIQQATIISGWVVESFREWDDILVEVFGDAALTRHTENHMSAMFAYLFRRFGYPKCGWDGGKELSVFYLTTPDDGIALKVQPSHSLRWAFRVVVNETSQWLSLSRQQRTDRIIAAVVPALRELSRPVSVDDSVLMLYGESEGDDNIADSSGEAGYGIGHYNVVNAANGRSATVTSGDVLSVGLNGAMYSGTVYVADDKVTITFLAGVIHLFMGDRA